MLITLNEHFENLWSIVDLEQERCNNLGEALNQLEAFDQRISSLEKSSGHSTLYIPEDYNSYALSPTYIAAEYSLNFKSYCNPPTQNDLFPYQDFGVPIPPLILNTRNYPCSPNLMARNFPCSRPALPPQSPILNASNFQSGSYGGRCGKKSGDDSAYGYSAWDGIARGGREKDVSNRENQFQWAFTDEWLAKDVSGSFRLKTTPYTQQVWSLILESPPRHRKPPKKYRCAVMGVAYPYMLAKKGKRFRKYPELRGDALRHRRALQCSRCSIQRTK